VIEIRDTSVPIVILQFSPYNLLHGGLGIARTAGRLGIPVYWVDGGHWAPATLSRYVRGRLVWNADAPAEALVEYLLERAARMSPQAILMPIDDIAAGFVADQAAVLRERFLFPDQPDGLARILSNKKEMHFLCKEAGVPTPEAAFPRSKDEVADFGGAAIFPIMLKRIAWFPEHRQQMKSVAIANNPEELLEEYEVMATLGKPNIMLQEYIPGGPESVWMFNGYFADDSECLAGFTGRKIRQAPPATGTTTLGICLKNEVVEKTTVDFMRKIGYSGIVDMDYRYDRRDGKHKLLDVNPRIGATFRLFLDSNGMDVVRALYLDLTGQPVRRGVPREGRKWVVEQSDLMGSLQYARLRQLTLAEWARSLRGVEEGAWFALDDPMPFAAMSWTSFLKAGHKLREHVRVAGSPQRLAWERGL
jgi:predicted ATP-grasp superfamily ATP-dependent carboligase